MKPIAISVILRVQNKKRRLYERFYYYPFGAIMLSATASCMVSVEKGQKTISTNASCSMTVTEAHNSGVRMLDSLLICYFGELQITVLSWG